MTGSLLQGNDIATLSRSERALVCQIYADAGAADPASLEAAQLRLRNIAAKYSEELKRARLAARASETGRIYLAEVQTKFDIVTAALESCRAQLAGNRPGA